MLVYFKNRHEKVTEIHVEPQETMREVMKIEELGGTEKVRINMLRYFSFEPSLKLRWFRARDLVESQISVTAGVLELRISCIRSSYLTH